MRSLGVYRHKQCLWGRRPVRWSVAASMAVTAQAIKEPASRLLIDTHQPVAEVAYHCGFNNISNFNRLFRKKKNCTPKEFRENYSYEKRVFI